ncbi:MAG: hypothetical protein NWF05_02275 [Candidatus Bathyarchaeota archaeon]|nr:hypothetical protein [Candidatus Bathyarchaeota archaeon]
MEKKDSREVNENNLCQCPYCACCFCTEADLKRHMDTYGATKAEHNAQFRRVHGRLEHGSFGGSE